jgi:N-acyl homoserine lactone hydrolase
MKLTRRDMFKVSGGAVAALGLSKFEPIEVFAGGGDVQVYAFICGYLKTETQRILKDTRVGVPYTVPVPFFIIRHGADWIAFDTGNNGQVAVNPIDYWGEGIVNAYTPVMKPHEEFRIQIKKLGLVPKNLKCAIISHGHLDHAGAIDNFVDTSVPIHFHKTELEAIDQAIASGKPSAYISGDFSHMKELNIVGIEGVLDLFGDESVVVFPTPGHTPGHQSVMVKANGKTVVLCQDACYTLENMMANIPIALYSDIDQAMNEIYHFRVMNYMGADIGPPHDPDYWTNKSLAPQLFKS